MSRCRSLGVVIVVVFVALDVIALLVCHRGNLGGIKESRWYVRKLKIGLIAFSNMKLLVMGDDRSLYSWEPNEAVRTRLSDFDKAVLFDKAVRSGQGCRAGTGLFA